MNQSEDEDDLEGRYLERVHVVSRLFRHRPRNMTEKMEEMGFNWYDDDAPNADEIAEERSARPITGDQKALVSFLEGSSPANDNLAALWRTETGREGTPLALWRRYFRAGSPQIKTLILLGLDQSPSDRDLLGPLAFFHEFHPIPKELLSRYLRACVEEHDRDSFLALAQDFDEAAETFGYDALSALRDRHAKDPLKIAVIEEVLRQRARDETDLPLA